MCKGEGSRGLLVGHTSDAVPEIESGNLVLLFIFFLASNGEKVLSQDFKVARQSVPQFFPQSDSKIRISLVKSLSVRPSPNKTEKAFSQ